MVIRAEAEINGPKYSNSYILLSSGTNECITLAELPRSTLSNYMSISIPLTVVGENEPQYGNRNGIPNRERITGLFSNGSFQKRYEL